MYVRVHDLKKSILTFLIFKLPIGVTGNTYDFDSYITGSNPVRAAMFDIE